MTVLNLDGIPEADKAVQVIKEWIRDSLYSYSIFKEDRVEGRHFLTVITELTMLAHMFDKADANDYIGRAPCIAIDKPKGLIRAGHQYVVHDLIQALDGSKENSASAGVLYLQ